MHKFKNFPSNKCQVQCNIVQNNIVIHRAVQNFQLIIFLLQISSVDESTSDITLFKQLSVVSDCFSESSERDFVDCVFRKTKKLKHDINK